MDHHFAAPVAAEVHLTAILVLYKQQQMNSFCIALSVTAISHAKYISASGICAALHMGIF